MQLIIPDYAATGRWWVGKFYASRLIRLMPLYYIVLLGTAAFMAYSGGNEGAHTDRLFCQGRADAIALCWFNNLFIIGQDVVRFMMFDPAQGNFYFASNVHNDALIYGGRFTLMGQSWSLALEIMFYALAPFFLLRSTRILVGVTVVSLALKFSITLSGLLAVNYNWNHCFFPAELGIFCVGALVCRNKAKESIWKYTIPSKLPNIALHIFYYIAAESILSMVKFGDFIFIGITASLPPSFFSFSQRSATDRMVGEWSYPIYMMHFLLYYLLLYAGVTLGIGIIVLALSTLLAIAFVRWVDAPLTRFRHNRFKTNVKST
jgi:peptidoglycan/LPS O-acetylase OafA/YrhL